MASIPSVFFLNGKLYRRKKEVKSEDYVTVFDYEEERLGRLPLSYVRRNMSKAFTVEEVAELLEISRPRVKSLVDRGLVAYPPARSYHEKSKRPLKWYWGEQDVMDLRDAIYNLLPKDRNGDLKSNAKIVGKAELRAKMTDNTAYYVRNADGEFIRVWKAVD